MSCKNNCDANGYAMNRAERLKAGQASAADAAYFPMALPQQRAQTFIGSMSSPPPQQQTRKSHPLMRPLFFVAGLILAGIGIVNLFIPGPPTTIFMILAVACFARSSPKLEAWVLNHPKLGPPVVAWREHGAIPRKAKIFAIVSMALSFVLVLVFARLDMWIVALIGAALLASAVFVASRPVGPKPSAG